MALAVALWAQVQVLWGRAQLQWGQVLVGLVQGLMTARVSLHSFLQVQLLQQQWQRSSSCCRRCSLQARQAWGLQQLLLGRSLVLCRAAFLSLVQQGQRQQQQQWQHHVQRQPLLVAICKGCH
jgi:hypothetical protein